jgi:HEPN domain-containing protein
MGSDYKKWLQASEDNLKWAKDNLEDGNYPLVCFLSQQTIELLLKGFIYSKNKIPPKTHNLVRLAHYCKKLGMEVEDILPKLALLSEYYFTSRYPDEFDEKLKNKQTAVSAFKKANLCHKKLKTRI